MTIPNLGGWGHVLFPLSFCRGDSQRQMLTGIIEKAWERYWCLRPKTDQLNEHVEAQEQAVHVTVMHCEGCTQESLNDKLSSSDFFFMPCTFNRMALVSSFLKGNALHSRAQSTLCALQRWTRIQTASGQTPNPSHLMPTHLLQGCSAEQGVTLPERWGSGLSWNSPIGDGRG